MFGENEVLGPGSSLRVSELVDSASIREVDTAVEMRDCIWRLGRSGG
jgi:hypothetical protein